jgi:Trypsin-co-occurring domain 1
MAHLVPLTFDDGSTIYVEAAEPAVVPGGSAIEEAAAGKDAATRAVDAARALSDSIHSFCERTVSAFKEMAHDRQPAKATVEFGVNISAEGNVYVVKGTAEATVTISAEWNFSNG